MAYSIYDASVPVFARNLKALSVVLGKGAAHAEAKSIDPEVLINWRLAPDMFPLNRQVQLSAMHATGTAARLAGLEAPDAGTPEKTFPELQARIGQALAYLDTFKLSQFEGAETRQIVLQMGPKRDIRLEFVGKDLLVKWALPNFFFHVTTAYGLLRHAGVPLGKRDFLGEL